MIQIPDAAASVLLEFYSRVITLDVQAQENNAMFRKHFVLLARQPPLTAAVSELRKAVDNHVHKSTRKSTTKHDD